MSDTPHTARDGKEGISVLICCYNGAARITETIRHLAAQRVAAGVAWEVLLVDNASTDGVAAVARAAWQAAGAPTAFRVVEEPVPGKNNAVDRGFREARYGYVVLCDDDNWLNPTYAQVAWEIMRADPAIGLLGGPSEGAFEAEPPAWFGTFGRAYAVGPQQPASGELPPHAFLWGAGLVVNRAAYDRLLAAGFRRIITHQRYRRIARTEDGEFCLALRCTGYKAWYDERLRLRHYVTRDRLRWPYLLQLTREAGLASPLMDLYRGKGVQPAGLMKEALWLKSALRRGLRAPLLRYALRLGAGVPEGDRQGVGWLFEWYKLRGYLWLGGNYDRHYREVRALKERLGNQTKRAEPSPVGK
jgi:glycosyltransferase involved in cell wall biosynthesis